MKDFESLYNEISKNKEIENSWNEARKEQKKNNKISLFVCLGLSIAIILIFIFVIPIPFNTKNLFFYIIILWPLIIVNLFTIIFINVIGGKNRKKYNNAYKKIAVTKLIENFYNDLEYFPQKQMLEKIYREGKYEGYYNRYYSDDYFEAKINNKYDIDMAEIITQHEEQHTDKDGHTETTTTTIFHGLFAKIIIDKSINCNVKIKQNGQNSNRNLKMDSNEFEKYFDVSTTNKIVTMQLLTSDIMEELVEFQNKTNIKYDVVINNNSIYLRYHCGAMFESGNLKKGFIDKKLLQKYFYILKFTYDLTNKIIEVIQNVEI